LQQICFTAYGKAIDGICQYWTYPIWNGTRWKFIGASKHVTRSQKRGQMLDIINQNQTFFYYHLKP
jgi:hypothetical protein